MNTRNWNDLQRKLVDKNDMLYTVESMQQFVGASALSYFGFGVLPTTFFPNPFIISMSGSVLGGQIGNGIAYDPQGNFISVNSSSTDSKSFTQAASDPTNPRWDLLVLRYQQDGQTLIPEPSNPIVNVYLNLVDGFQVAIIEGTASPTPSYPSKLPNDVILAGLKVPANATLGTQETVDLSIRNLASNNVVEDPVFVQEIPTGVIDGTNVTFTLSQNPINSQSLLVMLDNSVQPMSTWSLAGNVLTLNTAPALGQDVFVYYVAFQAMSVNPLSGVQEVPSGTINGTNAIFTLSGNPASAATLLVVVDGRVLAPAAWSLIQSPGSSEIQFNAGYIPVTGQDVYCFYLINPALVGNGPAPAVTGASNLGSGSQIFAGLAAGIIQMRTLIEGANITLTQGPSGITIAASGGGGGGGPTVYGSLGSPESFNPATGLTPGSEISQVWFLNTSAGVETVTATLQIAAGSVVGQQLTLIGTDAINNYVFQGTAGTVVNGLSLNGNCTIDNNQALTVMWDGNEWYEISRRR